MKKIFVLFPLLLGLAACGQTMEERAATGGLAGAGAGALLDGTEGALIGGAVGAGTGAVFGDEIQDAVGQ